MRAKHSGSHHRDLYYAVAALGLSGLDDLDVRVTEAQRARTKSFYRVDRGSEVELQAILALLTQMGPAVRAYVLKAYPDIADMLGA